MRILLDFDDTLVEFMRTALPFLNEEFGTDVGYEDIKGYNLDRIWPEANKVRLQNVFLQNEVPQKCKASGEADYLVGTCQVYTANVEIWTNRGYIPDAEKVTKDTCDREGIGDVPIRIFNSWEGNNKFHAVDSEGGAFAMIDDSLELLTTQRVKYPILIDRPWNRTGTKPTFGWQKNPYAQEGAPYFFRAKDCCDAVGFLDTVC